MATPFEELYANWLKTLSSSQSSSSTQWQKAAADMWQMPAAYWQTVGSIMGMRTQSVQQTWAKAPQHMQALAACKTWPEFVGTWMSIQGQAACDALNLDLTTNAFRAGLWKEWQNLAGRNTPWQQQSSGAPSTPQQTPAKPKTETTAAQPTAKPQPSTYVQQPGTFIPGPTPQQPQQPVKPFLNPKPVQEYQPQATGQRQPIFTQQPPRPLVQPQPQPKPVVAQVKQSQPTATQQTQNEMPLLTGTHGTVSPTANSVMRSGSGSTIASAAARRSVVARRQSRRRTPR